MVDIAQVDPLNRFLTESEPDSVFTVYFPVEQYADNTGDLRLKKVVFDRLLSKCLERYKKYTKSSDVIYSEKNQSYTIINRRDLEITQVSNQDVLNGDKYIVVKKCIMKIDPTSFPIKNIYNDICKQNKMNFQTSICKLSLITESYEDIDCNYFIVLSFSYNDTMQEGFVEKLKSVITDTINDFR